MKKLPEKSEQINIDDVEEVREVLKYSLESRQWDDVGEALELLNEVLGYETVEDEEEDTKRNRLEE